MLAILYPKIVPHFLDPCHVLMVALDEMSIALGGGDLAVSEPLIERLDGETRLDGLGREGMPKDMPAKSIPAYPQLPEPALDDARMVRV